MLLTNGTLQQLESMKCEDDLMNQSIQILIDLINWKP